MVHSFRVPPKSVITRKKSIIGIRVIRAIRGFYFFRPLQAWRHRRPDPEAPVLEYGNCREAACLNHVLG